MVSAVISGLGSYLPPVVVDNDEVCRQIESSDEWIVKRTGISTRRRVPLGTSTSDIAVQAAERALTSAGTRSIDMVVLATATPDFISPPTAPIVADRLGLTGTPAFDVSAACSGFVYGLSVASAMVQSGAACRVLFICAETASYFTDPRDRDTAAIFGDGAAALVISVGDGDESDSGAIGSVVMGADGSACGLVQMPGYAAADRAAGTFGSVTPHITMDGKPLFVQAVTRMTEAVEDLLERENLTTDDVAMIVPHQANARIIEAVAEELEVDSDRVMVNIDQTGNTISASIPLALAQAADAGRMTAGDRILVVAFGAGASWGATTFTWPDIKAVVA